MPEWMSKARSIGVCCTTLLAAVVFVLLLAPAPAAAGGGSNCCFANGGLGCDDASCEATVCGNDSFCCEEAWDSICASQAEAVCEVCGGSGGGPQPSICRGPGFWGTHAGNEKGNTNMVQTLLDEVGCLEVCGEIIDDTDIASADSAEEALCVSPKSGPQIQLARFLLTQALNCIVSTGEADCDPEAWAVCNAACEEGTDLETMQGCKAYLDCQANGGALDFEGNCITGSCQLIEAPLGEGNGEPLACGATVSCPEGYSCVPTVGCDDAALVNEELEIDWSSGSVNSSSENKCKRANKSACAVVGAREAQCSSGTRDEAESCCVSCGEACAEQDACIAACEAFEGCDPEVACDFQDNCFDTCFAGGFGTTCEDDCLSAWIYYCNQTEAPENVEACIAAYEFAAEEGFCEACLPDPDVCIDDLPTSGRSSGGRDFWSASTSKGKKSGQW